MYDSAIKSNWEEGKYFDAFIWRVKKVDDAVKGDVGEGLKLMGATVGVILSGSTMAMASYGSLTFWGGASGLMFSLDDFTSIGEKESFLESSIRNAIGDDAADLLKGAKIALSVKGAAKGFTNITVHLSTGEFMKGSYDAGKGILEIGGAVLDVKKVIDEKDSNDE